MADQNRIQPPPHYMVPPARQGTNNNNSNSNNNDAPPEPVKPDDAADAAEFAALSREDKYPLLLELSKQLGVNTGNNCIRCGRAKAVTHLVRWKSPQNPCTRRCVLCYTRGHVGQPCPIITEFPEIFDGEWFLAHVAAQPSLATCPTGSNVYCTTIFVSVTSQISVTLLDCLAYYKLLVNGASSSIVKAP
ncbi:hypothetical protein BCR34DRAFT_665308 [Clohesyomyces aquaticus]|uniref:Uncharacterized protein n=1 Tax=Clohesyomyces aquaticus TaxID=1231657 RepID=A0A1Y1ZI17_9PLEO|nr:hypothetical protein BCR34DRAFT_665308 [Clohesyomyces aquaticus]